MVMFSVSVENHRKCLSRILHKITHMWACMKYMHTHEVFLSAVNCVENHEPQVVMIMSVLPFENYATYIKTTCMLKFMFLACIF